MLLDFINSLIEKVEPRLVARTNQLVALEAKVARLSRQLEPWETGGKTKGARYESIKKRIDKSRANVYDRIIAVRSELEQVWADHGIDDITSVAFIEAMESDAATKAAATAKWDILSDEMKVDAAWAADGLLLATGNEINETLEKITEPAKLVAILAMLDQTEPTTEDHRAAAQRVEKAVLSRLRELKRLDEEHEKLIELVIEIRKAGGSEITNPHKSTLVAILKDLPKDRRLLAEKEIATWPTWGSAQLMTEVLEIITGQDRGTDAEEAARGRFPLDEGEDVADALVKGAIALKGEGNKCLSFLYDSGLSSVFSGEAEAELVEDVKKEYWKGQKERSKKTSYNARTLSRLASEARRKGLFGPVTVLEWNVGKGGYHTPSAGDVVDRLSDGKDGWYFFFCSIVSFHTVIIAMKKEGTSKDFQFIENGKVKKGLSKKYITDEFDSWENEVAANSRIWQAYLEPDE